MYLDDVLISVSLATVELRAAGEWTSMTFTEQGAFFDGREDPAQRENGTGAMIAALEAFVERDVVDT